MQLIGLFLKSLGYAIFYWLIAQPFRLFGNVFNQLFKGNGRETGKAIVKLFLVPLSGWITIIILGVDSVRFFGLIAFIVWTVLMLFFGSFLHSTVSAKLFDIQGGFESFVLGHTWGILILVMMTVLH